MACLKGKKLLILGGITASIEIIKAAKTLGVTTMVTDYLPDSPAKKHADKSFLVSTTNVDEVVELIRREKIDGLITGFIDSMLPYYGRICQKAGLPCYLTQKQLEAIGTKMNFKRLCRKFGIPVVEEYAFKKTWNEDDLKAMNYPVLVKPTDNSGGRGISICNNPEELMTNYLKAKSFSPTGKVLVEKYMSGLELTMFYAIQDGKVFLTGMSDRYTRHRQGGIIPMPVAHILPSVYLKTYLKELNSRAIAMFEALALQNGMIFIQAFVDDEAIVFYEMGYRLTGTQEYHILERECGVSTLKMMIHFALTGLMHDEDISRHVNPSYKKCYCLINFLVKPGLIDKMIGTDEVGHYPEVINTIYEHRPGDIIPESALGTLQQIAFRVFAEAGSRRELAAVMDRIHKTIRIFSSSGENMLLPPLETREMIHEQTEF